MSDVLVRMKDFSKRFLIPATRESAFRVLRKMLKGEPLTCELWALKDVSLDIGKGEKIAIVGKNGAGKTTLLRSLMRIHDATSGSIVCPQLPVALLRFHAGLNEDLSVIDNIFIYGAIHGMGRDFLMHRLHHIFNISELHHLQFSPLKRLSAGERQRLALSVFMQSPADFLVFDESLEFVDEQFARKVHTYLEELVASDKTVIITSNDLSFLLRFCRRGIWLEKGRLRMDGDAQKVFDEYKRSICEKAHL